MTKQDVRAGTSITERLVAALTATWRAIQDRHADVPDVVLTLGSGTLGARRGEVTLGHFAAGRWHTTQPANRYRAARRRGPGRRGRRRRRG